MKCGIDPHKGKFIRCDILVIFHRDVRYSLFQFCFHLQDDPSCLGISRSHIGMGKRIQNRAVYMDQEQADHLFRQFFIHILYKWIQKLIQRTQIYGEIRHAGNMLVKDQKGIQRLKKILWRIQLEKFTSFSHKFLIIRDDIPGAKRCMTLCQVANAFGVDWLIHQVMKPLRKIHYLQQGICQVCHCGYLLFMRQHRTFYRFQHFLSRPVYPFHINISHQKSSPVTEKGQSMAQKPLCPDPFLLFRKHQSSSW